MGTLKPSLSPWSSPMVPVGKPDGPVRLCIDFCRINKVTQPDPYTMPRVDEMSAQLGKARYLSTLDLNKVFYQIPLAEGDQDKSAFCTPWGNYQFTVMPFGLRNAPATFQCMMDQVLDGMLEFAGTYIDDIIIYSQSWEDHMTHVALVLEQLKIFGLTAKPSKCQWGASPLTFLGHTVGGGTMSVPDYLVNTIKQYVRPIIKHDVHALLERQAITGIHSSVCAPLCSIDRRNT